MKCPNCGAESRSAYCAYCGSKMPNEAFKRCCPKCGSTNLTFCREKQGEVSEKNGRRIIYKTVGVCRDCGFTSFAEPNPAQYRQENKSEKKRQTWLWVLGWILIFPLPLTIILTRSKMNKAIKIIIMVITWFIYSVIFLASALSS